MLYTSPSNMHILAVRQNPVTQFPKPYKFGGAAVDQYFDRNFFVLKDRHVMT